MNLSSVKMKKQKGRASPGDNAGDTDVNNRSGLRCLHAKESPAE